MFLLTNRIWNFLEKNKIINVVLDSNLLEYYAQNYEKFYDDNRFSMDKITIAQPPDSKKHDL